jgi:hypothetical protein
MDRRVVEAIQAVCVALSGHWSLADFFNILAQAIGDFKK